MIVIVAVVAAGFLATWTIAYRLGESDGRDKVSADRTIFQTRVASGPQAGGAGGFGQGGGAGGGAANGTPNARGAGGSAAAGGAPTQTAGSAQAGANGRQGGQGGQIASLTGKVMKVDGTTFSVQQTDNSTVSVTTTADTAVRKLVTGALTDLKTGDIVAVDGGKTGDNAYSAKTITGLGSFGGGQGGQGGTRGQGGAPGGGAQAGGAAVTGQIKSVSGGTLMIQGFDGASVTVTTTPTTVVRTQQPGTLSDIKTGDVLLIVGDKTSDTAFAARTITNEGPAS